MATLAYLAMLIASHPYIYICMYIRMRVYLNTFSCTEWRHVQYERKRQTSIIFGHTIASNMESFNVKYQHGRQFMD